MSQLHPVTPTDQHVLALAANVCGVDVERMRSPRRTRSLARARHVAAAALRACGRSYPEIAEALGRRDHTTAMHSVAVADPGLLAEVLDRMGAA